MKKTKKTMLIYIIAVVLLSLVGLWFISANKDTGVKVTPYNSPYGFTSGFGIQATTDDTTVEMRKELLLYVSDLSEPITLTFNNTQAEKERQVILTVYFDYKQIDFKVADENAYSPEYVFNIGGSQQVSIPIYLSKDIDHNESHYHKLMVSFVTGYDKQACDFATVENGYGITGLYDIVFDKSVLETNETETYGKPQNMSQPENIYKFKSAPLVLNTDYKNIEQQKDKDYGIDLPDSLLTVSTNETFDLMYNITNPGTYENALLIISVNYEQTSIEDADYLIVDLEKESVNNGKLTLTAPPEPGFYEVIGYVVFSPFDIFGDKLTGSHIAQTSYRFTLEVTD